MDKRLSLTFAALVAVASMVPVQAVAGPTSAPPSAPVVVRTVFKGQQIDQETGEPTGPEVVIGHCDSHLQVDPPVIDGVTDGVPHGLIPVQAFVDCSFVMVSIEIDFLQIYRDGDYTQDPAWTTDGGPECNACMVKQVPPGAPAMAPCGHSAAEQSCLDDIYGASRSYLSPGMYEEYLPPPVGHVRISPINFTTPPPGQCGQVNPRPNLKVICYMFTELEV